MAKKLEDGSISYRGYCIDLLNELTRNLKFTYDIYVIPDGKYGVETENGSWNGMIGELLNAVCKHVGFFCLWALWVYTALKGYGFSVILAIIRASILVINRSQLGN